MKLEVSVTEDDIKLGCPSVGNACPVAIAIERLGYKADVGDLYITLTDVKGAEVVVEVPAAVAEFVMAFDDAEDVQPFSFTIEF